MNSFNCIEQKGVIEKISDGKASVIFSATSVCGSCSAQGVCELFGTASRKIVVPVRPDEFSAGEMVEVVMEKRMGRMATVIAYLIPFLLLISSLLIGSCFKLNELAIGLISLGIIIVYFAGLYFFRNRFKKAFNFIIRKAF